MSHHDWKVKTPNSNPISHLMYFEIGIPILVDENAGIICEPVLFFITEKILGISKSVEVFNTLQAYANDLKDWWIFLDSYGFLWNKVKLDNLYSYCSVMRATKSPYTGQQYATSTIRRRVSTIQEFYKWAKNCSLYKGDIEESDLIHSNCPNPSVKLPKRASEKHIPSVLNIAEAKMFRETFLDGWYLKVL